MDGIAGITTASFIHIQPVTTQNSDQAENDGILNVDFISLKTARAIAASCVFLTLLF